MEHFEIAAVAKASADFRRVIWTGAHTQLVVMTIPVGGEIGTEVHDGNDQILTFIAGTARADIAGESREIHPGALVVVPAGVEHNFTNIGTEPLVLHTVYGPPDHADDTVHATKIAADDDEHDHA